MSVHIVSKFEIMTDWSNCDNSSGITDLTSELDFFVSRGFGAGVGIKLLGIFGNIDGEFFGLTFPLTTIVA